MTKKDESLRSLRLAVAQAKRRGWILVANCNCSSPVIFAMTKAQYDEHAGDLAQCTDAIEIGEIDDSCGMGGASYNGCYMPTS